VRDRRKEREDSMGRKVNTFKRREVNRVIIIEMRRRVVIRREG
jgi:hypothetical protein